MHFLYITVGLFHVNPPGIGLFLKMESFVAGKNGSSNRLDEIKKSFFS